ncbi:histone-lysine N-methyltransferase SETMAR [Trichonephila clavipes]|nr:histone-lysine N-methyltransferase SETMAR [Trichonephila clavipes]
MSSEMVRRWVRDFKMAEQTSTTQGGHRLPTKQLPKSKRQCLKIDRLQLSKVCARWVITADHKRQRVEAAQEFLAFHGKEEFLTIVTGEWTCNSEQEKMLTKGVRFHHDNARPHTANRTTALVERFGWEMVSHPPYSPDLAPSDFHLFPELKKTLRQMKRCKTRLLIFCTDRRQSSITCLKSGCLECRNAYNATAIM